MTQSFNCPNCGAPLDYAGTDLTIRCPFCSSSVIVPETLRPAAPVAGRTPSPEVVGLDTLTGQANQLRDVARLIRSGNKIQAIKVYREAFDVSLAEAKEAVDALEAGMPVVMPGQANRGTGLSLADLQIKVAEAIQNNNKVEAIRLYRANYPSVPLHQAQSAIEKFMATGKLEESTPPPAARERTPDPTIDRTDPTAQPRADIARLLAEGNKIQAIKVYRMVTNSGLAEAKKAVEDFEAGKPLVFSSVYASRPNQSSQSNSSYVSKSSVTYTNTAKAKPGNPRAALLGWVIIAVFAIGAGVAGAVLSPNLWPNTLRISAPFLCPNGYDDAYGLKENGSLVLHCIVDPDRNISHTGAGILIPLFFFYFLIAAWVALAIGFVRITGSLWMVVFLLPLATLLIPVVSWATEVPAGNNQDTFWLLFTTRTGNRFAPPALEQWLSARFDFATKTLAFGDKGTQPSYFNEARNITVDSQGTIYVADYNPGRVQIFDADGNFVNQWTVGDTYIAGIAAGPDNQLYVLSSDNLRSYNAITGQPLHEFKSNDLFTGFQNVGVEPDGSIVAVSNEAFTWFSPDGQKLRTSDTFKELLGDSLSPDGLTVDKDGNIYLTSSGDYKVYVFSSQGKLITKFGSEGDADDQFDYSPDAIAVDASGRIFAHGNYILKVFDSQGNYLTDTGITGSITDMAITPQNDLLILSSSTSQVTEYHLNK